MYKEPAFSRFPILKPNDKIILRELDSKNDALGYYNLMCDPAVHAYIQETEVPTSVEDAREKVKFWYNLFYKKISILWCIEKEGLLVGTIGFNYCDTMSGRAEIVYDLISSEWGKGIASTAMKAVLDFSFSSLNIVQIEALIAVNNVRSEKLLRKFNFILYKTHKAHRVIRGEYVDTKTYVLYKNRHSSELTVL